MAEKTWCHYWNQDGPRESCRVRGPNFDCRCCELFRDLRTYREKQLRDLCADHGLDFDNTTVGDILKAAKKD